MEPDGARKGGKEPNLPARLSSPCESPEKGVLTAIVDWGGKGQAVARLIRFWRAAAAEI